MSDLLILLVLLGVVGGLGLLAWTYARFLYRKLSAIPATLVLIASVLAGLLALVVVIGAVFVLALGGMRMKATESGPRSPCAIEGQPCDDAERESYLADLARQQIRDIPVYVGWRDELPWGQQTRITAVIASADRAAAQASISKSFSDQHVDRQTVAIGRKVRAELTGANVEITKPDQAVRDVTPLQNVTFEWLVKPTRPGKTILTLRLFNELITPNGPVELERPVLVHEMSVKIGLLDWLTWRMEQMKGLQWVIGGVLAVLGFGFVNRAKLRRWRRRSQASKTPPPDAAPKP
jgi:hypothetical protein